ncbi:MAG: vWA domain-containing protein [Deferrisomatales bacterium]
MNLLRMNRRLVSVLGVVAALHLGGCGGNESTPGPAQPGALVPDVGSPVSSDDTVTRIEVTASVEYDGTTTPGTVRLFSLVKDQAANRLSGLVRQNFTVVVDPKTAPKTLGDEAAELTTEASDDRVVALVIDSSGSMAASLGTANRMQVAKDAAKLFVSLMGPRDRTAVVDFDDAARIVEQLTADATALDAAIDQFQAEGATNLGAAVSEAVRAVGTRPGKRAAILLTDGDDTIDTVTGGPEVWLNNPASTRNQGLALAKGNQLAIYTVGLGADLSETGLADLRTIAAETGGRFFQAVTSAELLTAFGTTIPAGVDAQVPLETYVLTFADPVGTRPGQTTDVPVVLWAVFTNRNGTHANKFSGTYTVR